MKHQWLKYIQISGEDGQALITLLFFSIVGITITSAAAVVIAVNSLSTSRIQQGLTAYSSAEAGIENTLLRLLRDPNYTGETLTVGEDTVEVIVTGANPKIISSQAKEGNSLHKIEVQAQYSDNILTVLSWKEIF